jgi:hypothetical protein
MKSLVRFAFGTLAVLSSMLWAPCAFASGGWYLLTPPISTYNEHAEFLQGYKILDSKPLSQWTQYSAYDSASECEAAKNSLLMLELNTYNRFDDDYMKALSANKDPTLLQHKRWTTEKSNAEVNQTTASRCIKSDDPRLGK